MKLNVFFEEAQKAQIDALEIGIKKSTKLSFSLFRGSLDSYAIADDFSISARGTYQGKFGYASSEKNDKTTPKFLMDQIVCNAKVIDSEDAATIFKGSEKYTKKTIFNPNAAKVPVEDKIAFAKEVENKIKNAAKEIKEVEISYEEVVEEIQLVNSYGLNLKHKMNLIVFYASAVATDATGDTKTGYKIAFDADFSVLQADVIAQEVVSKTLRQLGGKPCASGTYKTVLSKEVVASFLSFFLENVSSEEVQKNTSLLKGKIGQEVASKKVTIEENPLLKNVFFRSFDDEGVATYNKKIIDKGVLTGYLYNLTTAEKEGVHSTGNGYKGKSGRAYVSYTNVVLKPGKKTEEDLFHLVKDGLYITSVQGLHAGMNPQSGNFSLQASGFKIEEGKVTTPVTLITIAGNLFDLFLQIKEIASNSELLSSGTTSSSVYVKSLKVSGE